MVEIVPGEPNMVRTFVVLQRGKVPFGLAFDAETAIEQAEAFPQAAGGQWRETRWISVAWDLSRMVRTVSDDLVCEILVRSMPQSVQELMWSGDPRRDDIATAYREAVAEGEKYKRKEVPDYDWLPLSEEDDFAEIIRGEAKRRGACDDCIDGGIVFSGLLQHANCNFAVMMALHSSDLTTDEMRKMPDLGVSRSWVFADERLPLSPQQKRRLRTEPTDRKIIFRKRLIEELRITHGPEWDYESLRILDLEDGSWRASWLDGPSRWAFANFSDQIMPANGWTEPWDENELDIHFKNDS